MGGIKLGDALRTLPKLASINLNRPAGDLLELNFHARDGRKRESWLYDLDLLESTPFQVASKLRLLAQQIEEDHHEV